MPDRDLGWFDDGRELVNGEITANPISASHWTAVVLTGQVLRKVFADGFLIRCSTDHRNAPDDTRLSTLMRGRQTRIVRPMRLENGALSYADMTIYQTEQAITPLAMPNVAVAVAGMLP